MPTTGRSPTMPMVGRASARLDREPLAGLADRFGNLGRHAPRLVLWRGTPGWVVSVERDLAEVEAFIAPPRIASAGRPSRPRPHRRTRQATGPRPGGRDALAATRVMTSYESGTSMEEPPSGRPHLSTIAHSARHMRTPMQASPFRNSLCAMHGSVWSGVPCRRRPLARARRGTSIRSRSCVPR